MVGLVDNDKEDYENKRDFNIRIDLRPDVVF